MSKPENIYVVESLDGRGAWGWEAEEATLAEARKALKLISSMHDLKPSYLRIVKYVGKVVR